MVLQSKSKQDNVDKLSLDISKAIISKVKNSRNLRTIELKRVRTTNRYLQDKMKQSKMIIKNTRNEIEKIGDKTIKLRTEINDLLDKLR